MSKFHKDIRRFVDCHNKMPSEFELSLEAGDVDDDGDIIRGQYGAIDTFCIGMPMYDLLGRMVGRLELTLFNALNYTTRTEENIEIPVEKWRIKDNKAISDNQRYKMLGNAVTTSVVKVIFRMIKKDLKI